jgi:diacylglycerol kinase (ATP)
VENRWLVVANPISGQGRAMHHRHEIEAVLQRHGVAFDFVISEHPGHAIELVARAVEGGCRQILAVGGDGTVQRMRQRHLPPAGRADGGGHARRHADRHRQRLGARPAHAEGLRRSRRADGGGASRLHDVGLAEFGDGTTRHFINVAGLGFDAHVVESLPDRTLGPLAYLVGLAKGLLGYDAVSLGLTFAGRRVDARAFVLFFAIGRYCGSGMNVAPKAEADDGLFDITLIQDLSRWEVVKSLRRLFDGTLLTHPKVLALREVAAQVDAGPVPVEADGELIGHAPVRFSILPRALRVLAPPD